MNSVESNRHRNVYAIVYNQMRPGRLGNSLQMQSKIIKMMATSCRTTQV
tara:strand:+ start:800 stop:946 length:147 start_codon:yes stop_codon:yes gene_type:complete